jgi:hypothetical protein
MDRDPASIAKMAADVLTRRRSLSEIIFSLRRSKLLGVFREFWWRGNIPEWIEIPKVNNSKLKAGAIAEIELDMNQFGKVFDSYSIYEIPDQIMFISKPKTSEDNINILDFRKAIIRRNRAFRKDSIDQGGDGVGIMLVELEKSDKFNDRNAFKKLKRGELYQSWLECEPEYKPTIISISASFCFHRVQKATKFIESFGNVPRFNMKAWLAPSIDVSDKDNLATLKAVEIFNDVKEFGSSSERMLRKAARLPRPGENLRTLNGHLGEGALALKERSQSSLENMGLVNPTKAEERRIASEAEAGAQLLMSRIAPMLTLFNFTESVRDECVAWTAQQAGINLSRPNFVNFFRSYTAGLTERAFLIALIAEADWAARQLVHSGSDNAETVLSMLGRDRFSSGLGNRASLREAFGEVPDVKTCKGVMRLCQMQIECLDDEFRVTRDMTHGDEGDDKKIAQVFLDYIYSYDRWDQPVHLSRDPHRYLEHRWRRLYVRFGLFGHLFL